MKSKLEELEVELNPKIAEEIRNLWEMFEQMEPDISTERLFAMIEDAYNALRAPEFHIDAGHIAEAMEEFAE